MRLIFSAAGAAGILLAAANARASGADISSGLVRFAGGIEVAIPDIRLELGAPVHVVLSFPVHLSLEEGQLFDTVEPTVLSLFVEPQYRLHASDWRGIAGVRVTAPVFSSVAVILESGGLVGTDGHGVVAGGGVGFTSSGVGFGALILRHAFTTEGQRTDASLDVLYVLW